MVKAVHLYFTSADGENHQLKLSSIPVLNGIPTAASGSSFAGLPPGTTALLQFDIRMLGPSSRQYLRDALASETPVPIGLSTDESLLAPGLFRPAKVEDLMAVGNRGRLHLRLD